MMASEITMPKLGESVTEGTISRWLVAPGDHVNKYDPIAEVITDKVNAEIPSSYSGTIRELLVQEDETVGIGTVICTIDAEGSPAPTIDLPESKSEVTPVEESQSQKRRYSPAVLRMSQEHEIDLELVTGSGKGGRITRKDIQRIIESGQKPTKPIFSQTESRTEEDNATKSQQATNYDHTSVHSGDTEIQISGVRKAIAANMVKSVHEAPHAWMMVEVDVTNLVNRRNQLKQEFTEKEGFSLTFLPFFIKAIVESLKEFPQMNSMWAGDKIIQKKDINISIAVATDDALFVPVIKHADEKSIKGLAREVQELAAKVRTGKLNSDAMQGGTFTVNNTGSFGSIISTPIINQPQAAILSIESIVKRPVVIESDAGDMIAIRSMVNLCLSLDHRVLDGLICGRFLASVKKKLEQMGPATSIY
ncbi:2-oxo acid dehydrogenase subunit E2 [bacterium LRH843]|nr:2-oxo acid dehydrogenase subunit E2 [bacterium LRH843]